MPGLTSTSFGSGDQRWLGSTHGLRNARSGYALLESFSRSEHYPDGYIPSGMPVNAAQENDLRPYTGAEGEQLGFIVNSIAVPVGEDPGFTTQVLRHGLINTKHLPVDLPTEDNGNSASFVFVGGDE